MSTSWPCLIALNTFTSVLLPRCDCGCIACGELLASHPVPARFAAQEVTRHILPRFEAATFSICRLPEHATERDNATVFLPNSRRKIEKLRPSEATPQFLRRPPRPSNRQMQVDSPSIYLLSVSAPLKTISQTCGEDAHLDSTGAATKAARLGFLMIEAWTHP
jgi:hypothetical protein